MLLDERCLIDHALPAHGWIVLPPGAGAYPLNQLVGMVLTLEVHLYFKFYRYYYKMVVYDPKVLSQDDLTTYLGRLKHFQKILSPMYITSPSPKEHVLLLWNPAKILINYQQCQAQDHGVLEWGALEDEECCGCQHTPSNGWDHSFSIQILHLRARQYPHCVYAQSPTSHCIYIYMILVNQPSNWPDRKPDLQFPVQLQ